jgi:hypothetical protein
MFLTSLTPQQLPSTIRQHLKFHLLHAILIDSPLRISALERKTIKSVRVFFARRTAPDLQRSRVAFLAFVGTASGFAHFVFAGWGVWFHA